MSKDIVVIGAGPVGLAFAKAVALQGRSVLVLDRCPLDALEDPDFDGREIALSQPSVDCLTRLGAWGEIPEADISPIRAAKVIDGDSPYSLDFARAASADKTIGRLVPNHVIRRAVYRAAAGHPGVEIRAGSSVDSVSTGADASTVCLDTGERISAPLVVAADTRFSATRRQVGISASMHDFGQTMLIGRMAHSRPHAHTAWECFYYGATVAALPLNGDQSSIILTLPHHKAQSWIDMNDGQFARAMQDRMDGLFGEMTLVSERKTYPLVGVFADRFAAPRFALIGDAAVGMHPVTAHGYNFGLQSVERLCRHIGKQGDPGCASALRRYDREHRLKTWPLYQATQKLVELYTAETLPARMARKAALRAANLAVPAKSVVLDMLTRRAA